MAERAYPIYPVGQPGTPWGDAEKEEWLSRQSQQRDYFTDVVSRLLRIPHVELFQYGELDYRCFGSALFPLFGARSRDWDPQNRLVLVTGGVHGYETSGIMGALLFLEKGFQKITGGVNILVLPCLSPWGYEHINRWTPKAVDPNRCFKAIPGCQEAEHAMKCISEHLGRSKGILMHMDLHETTDTDNSEFMPAEIARDGIDQEWSEIPDGFYLVSSSHAPHPEWQNAIIQAVEKVTHIARADEAGCIIGEEVRDHGVIRVEAKSKGLCGAHTEAEFATTTEVYPDSAKATEEQCNEAQFTAVMTGLEKALLFSSPRGYAT